MKNIHNFYRRILVLGLLLCSSSIALPDDILGPTEPYGDGWVESPWFGWVFDPHSPYYMHAQHGWIYTQRIDTWLVVWDYSVREWFGTTSETYPMVYDYLQQCWFWYYKGTAQPRWYVDMETDEYYTDFHGALVPHDMVEMVYSVMEMTEDGGDDEEPNVLNMAMMYALAALLGDPATMVCPTISRTPEVIDLMALPPNVEAVLDFGTGCTAEDSDVVMAGSLSVFASNVVFGETGIAADLVVDADSLSSDGVPFLDGDIVGSVNVGMGLESTTYDVSFSLNNLTSLETSISGEVALTGWSTLDEEDELSTLELNASVTNLLIDGELPINGSVSISMDETAAMDIYLSVQTLLGDANLEVTLVPTDTGGFVISTTSPATLMGYSIEIDDVHYEDEICDGMPQSGSMTIGMDGILYTVTFTGDCEEGFRIWKH